MTSPLGSAPLPTVALPHHCLRQSATSRSVAKPRVRRLAILTQSVTFADTAWHLGHDQVKPRIIEPPVMTRDAAGNGSLHRQHLVIKLSSSIFSLTCFMYSITSGSGNVCQLPSSSLNCIFPMLSPFLLRLPSARFSYFVPNRITEVHSWNASTSLHGASELTPWLFVLS